MSNVTAFPKIEPPFRVNTTIPEYGHHKDVTFYWFKKTITRRRQALYEVLINDYNVKENNAYAEWAIEELFSADEAAALKAYLDAVHGDAGTTVIEPVELPMRKSFPFNAIEAGGGVDYYELCREPEYNLPFEVWGFFDEQEEEPPITSGQFPFYSSLRFLWTAPDSLNPRRPATGK
jgi:hypothetical protein